MIWLQFAGPLYRNSGYRWRDENISTGQALLGVQPCDCGVYNHTGTTVCGVYNSYSTDTYRLNLDVG